MNNNVIKGLLGLTLVLLLILFIEWMLAESPEQAIINSMTVEQAESELFELPVLELSKKSQESYSQMVERPLFVKGRKPIIHDEETDNSNEDIGEIDDLVLLGIYSIKTEKVALFNKKGKDRNYLKKSEGQDVSGWLLIEIQTDRVVLEQDGKQQTVMLRKPKPKSTKQIKRKLRKSSLSKKIKLKS